MKSPGNRATSKPPKNDVRVGARPPGRPPRISREAIIQKSLEILATTPVDEFMLKAVSNHLGTAPTAIYKYFDSREAVLTAVADEVCRLFKPPKPAATWQETLRTWMWAVKKHADRYPVMPWIIGLNGKSRPEWLRITGPIVALLRREIGLRGQKLAIASFLLTTILLSLIRIVEGDRIHFHSDSFPDLDAMPLCNEELVALREVQKALPLVKDKQIFDAAFAELIKGVELLS